MLPLAMILRVPLNATHLKSTSVYSGSYTLPMAANLDLSLVDGNAGTSWGPSSASNQRLHFDLVTPAVVTRIYYENAHSNGAETASGLRNFTLWGSNSASDFNDLVYANDGTWTRLLTSPTEFAIHVAANTPDPKFIEVSNFVFAFRYYAVKVADSWGSGMNFRRIALMGYANPPAPALPMRGPRMR